jgi:Peptidase family M28
MQTCDLRRRRSLTQASRRVSTTTPKAKTKPTLLFKETARPSGVSTVFACIVVIVAGTAAAALFRSRHAASSFRDRAESAPSALFSVHAAMSHVKTVASKLRLVGSVALEESLDYVYVQLAEMADVADRNAMRLEVDAFTANGSFAISMAATEIVVSYKDIRSVVARLSPVHISSADECTASLLVNSHVDSGLGSPGANDDVAAVAIMLESLHSLASTPREVNSLARPLVFLFNGAEEPLLAGADGFIKTHRWAQDIAAVINLESIGSGDGYELFQLGPRSSWLASAYATAVRRPMGSAAASEIFELGVIPGETDFRIFSAAGIPGYDFALVDNGRIYHTIYDDAKHVSTRVLEYGGKDLLLPLIMQLAGSEKDAIGKQIARLASSSSSAGGSGVMLPLYVRAARALPSLRSRFNLSQIADDGSDPRVAFFDYLGVFTVVYSEHVAVLLGWGITALSIVFWYMRGSSEIYGVSSTTAYRVRMLFCLLACLCAGPASAAVTAVFYVKVLNRPLSWYSSTWSTIAVFAPPLLVGIIVVLQTMLPAVMDDSVAALSYDSMLFAVSMFYTFLTSALTVLGLMTSFIPMLILAGCLVIASGFIPLSAVILHVIIMAATLLPVGALTAYYFLGVILSLMGRAGTAPSELIASAVVSYMVMCYWVIPLLPVLALFPRSLAPLRSLAVSICVVVAGIVWILPELSLPHRNAVYSHDAPKRVAVAHFHSPSQSPSMILGIVALDSIPVDVDTIVRMLPFRGSDAIGHTPGWGFLNSTLAETSRPYQKFLADWTVFDASYYVLDLSVPRARVVNEHMSSHGDTAGMVNITIAVSAPGSMQISLRIPLLHQTHGVVHAWSFDSPLIDMGDGGGCWLRHVGCGTGAEELEFSVLVAHDQETRTRPLVVFDVTSMRPGKSKSSILPQLYFPQWVAPIFTQITGETFAL